MIARRHLIVGLALGLAGLGCAHTKTTADTSGVSEPPPGASPPTDHPPATAGEGKHPAHHAQPTETSGIPVASSPEALLAPGGEKDIRDKLAGGGYLKTGDEEQSTQAALRKFQKEHDLPETGIPDHQTVKALGLDPNRIFKHADVNK
jgi:peptidoglycan hydrolase-like protein with peptidoglycan-binding domain